MCLGVKLELASRWASRGPYEQGPTLYDGLG